MRRSKKILFLAVALSVLTIFSQNASATLERVLPDSSYYDGSIIYDQDTDGYGRLVGRIDFAVYVTNQNEFTGNGGYETPGDGQYIYAYQIFNDYEVSEAAINASSIFGVDGHLLNRSSIRGLSEQEDYSGDDPSAVGVEPNRTFFEDIESKVVWEFEDGYLEVGDHSMLLVFSSNQAPIEGGYELGYIQNPPPAEGEESAQTNNNPEPTTILLLGSGAVMLLRKRKKLKS